MDSGVWTLDSCYNAAYMSQNSDQQRFTTSILAADWHQLIAPQRVYGHAVPTITDSWTRGAVIADTPLPKSATLGFLCVVYGK